MRGGGLPEDQESLVTPTLAHAKARVGLQSGTALRRGIIALEVFYVLLALSAIGQGDPRGVVNLVLPAVILVLLFRADAKNHFAGRAPASGSYF